MNMKKVLFIDRDGTILQEPLDEQLDTLEKLIFLPYCISSLSAAQNLGYQLVLVSNQDGLGTASFPKKSFLLVQEKMLQILASEGIFFDEIFIDHHFPEENHPNRKPGIGMLKEFLSHPELDLDNSYTIGDRFTDVLLAKNLGCKALWLIENGIEQYPYQGIGSGRNRKKSTPEVPFIEVDGWKSIFIYLESKDKPITFPNSFQEADRISKINRKTNETEIKLELNLDGSGKYSIDTGLKFYDHMLEQLVRHSGIDLKLNVQGDLQIDEHHTIEDSAIAIGQAFKNALGNKQGIGRYGFLLPMDEALVRCALDFSGRACFIFKGNFNREYVGDFPTEMLEHWLKSFSENAGLNLNLEILEGSNTHHKIEASFKALAKSLGQAIKKEGNQLPSTKGRL
jgi:imidazoleglycerol-phosphate dehydratase/histidinol-phosphatase